MHDHGYQQYYSMGWRVNGSSELASELKVSLQKNMVACDEDGKWGMDHAVWMPLSVMFSDGDTLKGVPVVEVSLVRNFDKFLHQKLGECLH
jgi:aromatic ring-opening dioxygenase catalytic subunit (LigB family)